MSRVDSQISSKTTTMVQSLTANSGDACARCPQQIYPLELMGQIMGLKYHKQCFKCYVCDRNLDFKTYKTNLINLNDNSIYCSSHAPKNGKVSADFQAIDNLPKNITQEYASQRKASIGSNISVGSQASAKSNTSTKSDASKKSTESTKSNASEKNPVEKAATVIVQSVLNKSVEKSMENLAAASDDDEDVRQATAIIITSDSTRGLSSGEEEVQWKEIYDNDQKIIEANGRYFETQESNDSAFYKKSTEKLDRIKWEYLDFKAGRDRPGQSNLPVRKTPDIYRKQYGPWDSAYKTNPYEYSKASWKEIFENDDKTTLRQAKKSNLDLLDKDELTWREIYERDYYKQASTENIVQEIAVPIEPEIVVLPEPPVTYKKVIDSLSMDSSRINKIPSKESIKEAADYRIKDRIKSDSYVSTKETATYHHQLSETSHQKHVSVMVPMIINNRESALDEESSNAIQITKSTVDEKSAENRKQMLDELMKQKIAEVIPEIVKEDSKKIIEPAVVIPSKPVLIEQTKPVVVKETKIMGENKGYGVVKLTVHYDELRSRLSITAHQAQNLKNVEKNSKKNNDMSDPYCRIYLVPDDKKSFKRKTKVVKNNLNPKWEETFDYKLSYEQSVTKDLIVSLKDDKKGLFSKQETRMLGEVRLRLADLGIKKPYTRWFFLQPLGAVSKLLLNSGINPYKK